MALHARAFTRARRPEAEHGADRSPADQTGEEHGFLRVWIERQDLRDLTRTRSDRRGEAGIGELVEPPLRLRQLSFVARIEKVTAVAGTVHHDLDCDDRPPRNAAGQGSDPVSGRSRGVSTEEDRRECW